MKTLITNDPLQVQAIVMMSLLEQTYLSHIPYSTITISIVFDCLRNEVPCITLFW